MLYYTIPHSLFSVFLLLATPGNRTSLRFRAYNCQEETLELIINQPLSVLDPAIYDAIKNEERRQSNGLELIASENYTYKAVMEAVGSVFTNKYAEGYPGRRYYGGCEYADVVESLAIERAKKLFGAEHVNVQPHSGSQANMAVYFAALKDGDTILSLKHEDGAHLSHGHPLSWLGKHFNVVRYGVLEETEQVDYDHIEKLAMEIKPALIIVGGSAYPRKIDFQRIAAIASLVEGCRTMADIAHIAGLVATGEHTSPVPWFDYVTTTTHKTLRGPRGGLIMCKSAYAKEIDSAVFPREQGGPLVHVIAGKAVCLELAATEGFRVYTRETLLNAKTLAEKVASKGLRVVTKGTDTHLFLADLASTGILGKQAENALHNAGITINRNSIPFDSNKPLNPGGVRIGTPAVTTRGMGVQEMGLIGGWISEVLYNAGNESLQRQIKGSVNELCRSFPLYK